MKRVKYTGPLREKINWPPMQAEGGKDPEPYSAGEPHMKLLKRWSNDKALTAHEWSKCCGCGFLHFTRFEVFRDPKRKDDFWLVSRAWAYEPTRPKKARKL
jgi:hypothetical protein